MLLSGKGSRRKSYWFDTKFGEEVVGAKEDTCGSQGGKPEDQEDEGRRRRIIERGTSVTESI